MHSASSGQRSQQLTAVRGGLPPASGAAGPGAQGLPAGGDPRRRHRALPAGHRGRGVFLHPGGAAEHR